MINSQKTRNSRELSEFVTRNRLKEYEEYEEYEEIEEVEEVFHLC